MSKLSLLGAGTRNASRLLVIVASICASNLALAEKTASSADAEQFLVVDCLLPAQVRRLGSMTYSAARKAVKVSASECESRGGEYVAYDRASRATTLKVWLPLAEQGDVRAQVYVGETFEKGFGVEPDYASAAAWYLQAAEQGSTRAAVNLGNLFELGLGLARDPKMAQFWYRTASKNSGVNVNVPEPSSAPAPGSILIIEPELNQRGIEVRARPTDPTAPVLVIGQVEGDQVPSGVLLNNEPARMVGNRMFRGTVTPIDGKIEVVALFQATARSALTFSLEPGSARAQQETEVHEIGTANVHRPEDTGQYHALVIGNNDYQALPDLNTAANDASAVARLLEKDYGFSVTLLLDADRYQILSALNELRSNFSENDRLLIYYAGHGELDRVNNRGHWLPVDAESNSSANWISNISITDMVNIIPARQLIIIADSCYSGMMSRSVLGISSTTNDPGLRASQFEAMSGARTRTALTSGGIAPVLDGGGGQNSLFAAELLEALRHNSGAISGLELFEAIRARVESASRSLGFRQQPEYAPLQFAGHEAGDFVFYKTK